MTVYRNMAFGLTLRRFPRAEIDQRVREAAQILGIGDLLDRKPRALSGGERQRVAVGRAIVRKPQVFLFDEPLSNLDAKMRVQMRAEISKLHSRLQTTMIYVTHDQVEAMTMGDRIVVMKDGVVQQIAEPLTLYDHPANRFVAGFIGSPPMNFLSGAIEAAGDDLYFNEGDLRVRVPRKFRDRIGPYQGKPVVFGIRPEDFYDPAFRSEELEQSEAIAAKVELIEPMGSELYMYLSTGRSTFIARLDAHVSAELDEVKPLRIDMNKAHFFDLETEKAIV
jgi:multiple sugar transport system ATP-binding protein